MRLLLVTLTAFLYLLTPQTALAHANWCHLWRSCPADNNEYVCGAYNIYTYCPENDPRNKVKVSYTYKTVTETEKIPFTYQRVEDNSLPYAEDQISQLGQLGEKQVTYQVTYKNGVEDSRVKTGEKITKEPVSEIHLVGTKLPQFMEEAEKEVSNSSVEVAAAVKNDDLQNLLITVFLAGGVVGFVFRKNLPLVSFNLLQRVNNWKKPQKKHHFKF